LTSGGGADAAAEAADSLLLQGLEQGLRSLVVFSPVQELTGRPLFGNGANRAARTGRAMRDGGWIVGSGGNSR
jgi:hypothetical protein